MSSGTWNESFASNNREAVAAPREPQQLEVAGATGATMPVGAVTQEHGTQEHGTQEHGMDIELATTQPAGTVGDVAAAGESTAVSESPIDGVAIALPQAGADGASSLLSGQAPLVHEDPGGRTEERSLDAQASAAQPQVPAAQPAAARGASAPISLVSETEPGRVLVVDDDQTMCEFLALTLGRQHQVKWETSGHLALERVLHEDFDVILTDLNMTDLNGLDLCERIIGLRPDIPIIVVTGHGSMESAVGAMRAGAYDFITKPIDTKLIGLTVGRALQRRRLGEEVKRLRKTQDRPGVSQMIGNSSAIRRVFDLLNRVRNSDATILITGESGTGKELVAKAIHDQSTRSAGPFLAINCAAMPSALLESELFGHVRGAFTDAKTTRNGLFVEAKGGTIFLDEIGELPLDVQPKLLRALQERKVRPVGGNQELPFDARIVTATNRDLETEVSEKRFREDLYYRINVVTVPIPPLRERGADVLLLAQYFIERAAARANKDVKGIAPAAAEKLCAYDWPGNVRELENCMERAVALMRFDSVVVDDLPEKIRSYKADRLVLSADDPSELVTVAELERRYTRRVLALVGGNKSRAAKILGFDRRTLYRKMERIENSHGQNTHGQNAQNQARTP